MFPFTHIGGISVPLPFSPVESVKKKKKSLIWIWVTQSHMSSTLLCFDSPCQFHLRFDKLSIVATDISQCFTDECFKFVHKNAWWTTNWRGSESSYSTWFVTAKVYGQQSQTMYLEQLCSIINELLVEWQSLLYFLFFHASCTHFFFVSFFLFIKNYGNYLPIPCLKTLPSWKSRISRCTESLRMCVNRRHWSVTDLRRWAATAVIRHWCVWMSLCNGRTKGFLSTLKSPLVCRQSYKPLQ